MIDAIVGLFSNRCLMCALTGWFFAQSLKIPTHYWVEKKLDWRRFFGAGGMPSSHTAMVVSLALSIGAQEGFASAAFAVSTVLAFIVMYDASGVRRETGRQSQVINEILQKVLIDGKPISNSELKEVVGHSPLEVLGGAIVGCFSAGLWILLG